MIIPDERKPIIPAPIMIFILLVVFFGDASEHVLLQLQAGEFPTATGEQFPLDIRQLKQSGRSFL